MTCSLHDVVVVGSGPAGLAAAAAAARTGLTTVLVDPDVPGSDDGNDGRVVALTAAARDRMVDLASWPALADATWALRGVRVQDVVTGREHLYRARELGRAALVHVMGYAELRRRLRRCLMAFPAVRHVRGRRLSAVRLDASARHAVLDDGTMLRGRLLVGADGRRSTVRTLAGLSGRATNYPMAALSFTVSGRLAEADTALERLTDSGPITALPLAGDRLAVNWIDRADEAQRRLALAPGALLRELAAAFDDRTVADLALATPIERRKLSLANADRYVAQRLVLVGDAAHGGHPVPAQGFNIAIGDVHELAVLWRSDPRRFASPDTLHRFQRNRRMANAARLGVMDVFNRSFTAASAPFAFMRGTREPRTMRASGADLPLAGSRIGPDVD